MRKSLIGGIAAALVVGVIAVWAAAPVLAAQSLIKAAKAGDAERIETLVDFTALRASLKTELNAEMVARMRDDPQVRDSGLGGLGLMLAPMLLSGAVDVMVTPDVVAQMVTTADTPDPQQPREPESAGGADRNDIHQSWGYRDMDTFAVTLTDRDRPDQHLALILERRGILAWKLAAVDLQRGA